MAIRQDTGTGEADGDNLNPEARVFDSDGAQIAHIGVAGGEYTTQGQLAGLADGAWVAVWIETTLGRHDIYMRIYDDTGNAVTAVLPVATELSGLIGRADVVALPDGDFVVSWGHYETIGQRFNANGTPDGSQFVASEEHGDLASALTADGRIVFTSDYKDDSESIGVAIWDPRDILVADASFADAPRLFLNPLNFTTRRASTFLIADQFANLVLGQEGNDTVVGEEGNDTVLGRNGGDSIDGGIGSDSIEGGAGNDTLTGGQGSDILLGGGGRDTASYAASNAAVDVTLNGDINANHGGHAEGDEMFAMEALIGSAFNDTLRGTVNSSAGYAAYGGGGNDSIAGTGNSTTGGGDDTLRGEAGADTIFGSFGRDLIEGGSEADSLNGGSGDDTVRGGDGADSIMGGASSIGLFGRGGNDLLDGGAGADTLRGDVGDDTLNGGAAADSLDGGSGTDWADYSTGGRVRADLLSPMQNTGEAAGDQFVSIENLRGGSAADVLRGDDNANRLDGGAKNDVLTGRAGNDTLVGGAGFDQLTGQQGVDTFVLTSVETGDLDSIADFQAGEKIALSGAAFGLALGDLNPDAFIASGFAQDAEDRILYAAVTGNLFFDSDGVGGEERVLIASFENLPALSASDFIVI